MTSMFPSSRHSHYQLIPGDRNTTTKVPLVRPPDIRLVSTLASKGKTLNEALRNMNQGPRGRSDMTMLQTLTTRDVLLLPDLFEPSSGFILPPDPWDNGVPKTIYQRLMEEIAHAGRYEGAATTNNANNHRDRSFTTDEQGIFQDSTNGLFKAWHKTTAQCAGNGLADNNGRDGNGHLIVNDKDKRWQQAQSCGEAPMYTAIHRRIEEFFEMQIQGKRYNHYRDLTNWKPFHHDAAGLDKDASSSSSGNNNGRSRKQRGGGSGRPPMCETQNMTVGVSFGESRQAAFEWAGGREKKKNDFPKHLLSPPVNTGHHSNVVLSLTVSDGSTYTFGRDVNLLWKHGILAEKPSISSPGLDAGSSINVEEGRISIIAWGWVDQYDELDGYLDKSSPWGTAVVTQRNNSGGQDNRSDRRTRDDKYNNQKQSEMRMDRGDYNLDRNHRRDRSPRRQKSQNYYSRTDSYRGEKRSREEDNRGGNGWYGERRRDDQRHGNYHQQRRE
jgi:hypothetical protein